MSNDPYFLICLTIITHYSHISYNATYCKQGVGDYEKNNVFLRQYIFRQMMRDTLTVYSGNVRYSKGNPFKVDMPHTLHGKSNVAARYR